MILAGAMFLATGFQALFAEDIHDKTMPRDKGEERIVKVLADMYRNQRQGMMNVSPEDGRLLRVLTEAVGARHVVEIGTSNGYSALWICMGLRNNNGKLTTFEINSNRLRSTHILVSYIV